MVHLSLIRALGRIAIRVAVMLISAAAVLPAAAQGSPSPPVDDRQAPRLDPGAPEGAWVGYSTGDPAVLPRGAHGGGVSGMDVSGHQGDVDWGRAHADGAQFVYVKATEGTAFRNDHFEQQYHGSYDAGMIRGSYHFALPDRSTAAEQAAFFVDHGGGWSPDGRTLPGALDIESNPYGDVCYGQDPAALSGWIAEFSNTYRDRTGRFPLIYTTTSWWEGCTGANPDFAANNPLWVARHSSELGALPAGWHTHTMWQFSDQGVFPGDQNTFNGAPEQLAEFIG